MGKGSAPAPPDYTPIAQSDEAAAQLQAQTSTDQLNWAKEQYADQAPYTNAMMQDMAGVMSSDLTTQQQAQQQAQQAQQYYQGTYQPIETQFAQEAQGYNTPAMAEQRSAAAQADVASSFGAQREAATQSLESYGIDPSQTRYSALDLGTRISQAAAQSAAGTQSALNSQATGLALQGEAINIGRGYPGQIAQSYSTATGAGSGATSAGGSGVNAGLATSSTYGNMMGSPAQWAGLSQQNLAGAANVMNTGYQNALGQYNANAAVAGNNMAGIGGMVGAAAGVAAVAI